MSVTIERIDSSNNNSQGEVIDAEGVVNDKRFNVQVTDMSSPRWYDDCEDLSDDDRSEVLAAIEEFGVVTDADWTWEHRLDQSQTESLAIGFRVYVTDAELEARNLDWSDVIAHISEQAKHTLDEEDYAAWMIACQAGRGPDADADVNGVRWVANEDDCRLGRAIVALSELADGPGVREAVKVIEQAYNLA